MFVRKLSYLSPNECYKKVELDIYENVMYYPSFSQRWKERAN